MEKKIPRLLFAAPKSRSGKTLITCGFLEALKERGAFPVSFKCGPDYIDPMFHNYVLGISGRNLDSFFQEEDKLKEALLNETWEKGKRKVAVIEGVMGYYDGLGGSSVKASSYEVAVLTETPSVLILDCKGASLSLAAEVKGFLSYQAPSMIKGVILNRLSPMLYSRLKPAIEEMGAAVFGYLPELPELHLKSRRLGLIMPGEIPRLREKIKVLAAKMEETLDIDGLLKLAGSAPSLTIQTLPGSDAFPAAGIYRIGIARDEAFCFYYQENLRLLEQMGAELVAFSPIHDKGLPGQLDGLLLGGGYPEQYARELSENQPMLEEVNQFCKTGKPVLAECGGFLYLHHTLEGADGKEYRMASVIEAKAYQTNRLQRFGYIGLTGPGGISVKGHEFHYWESSDPGSAFKARKPAGERQWQCIHKRGGLICGFPHLYFPSNPEFIRMWMENLL